MDEVVSVDEQDNHLGLKDKVEAHLGDGQLHRAFTIFIFNSEGKTLLAQRSASKMLWPLTWDSACASHPGEDENYESAGERRLQEELEFTCRLEKVDQFKYHEKYLDVGAEHELCVTLVGHYDGEIKPNPEEVADYKWVGVNDLKDVMLNNPEDYAVWLKIAFDRLVQQNKIQSMGG